MGESISDQIGIYKADHSQGKLFSEKHYLLLTQEQTDDSMTAILSVKQKRLGFLYLKKLLLNLEVCKMHYKLDEVLYRSGDISCNYFMESVLMEISERQLWLSKARKKVRYLTNKFISVSAFIDYNSVFQSQPSSCGIHIYCKSLQSK